MKNLKALSIALSILLGFFAQLSRAEECPERKSSIYFIAENDIGFSDRYYTNGLKLTYLSPSDDWLLNKLQFKFLRLLNSDKSAQTTQSLSLGQDMYVSYDIDDTNPPMTDRPYAGWLYITDGAHIATKNTLDSFAITIGVVGEISGAEYTQKRYHEFINVDRPMGWDTQLKNEPAFTISLNHSERVFEHSLSDNFRTDFICSAGANLGTVSTEGIVKGLWRFGFNMPYSFDAARIEFSSSQQVEYAMQNRPDWHAYIYAGFVGKAVGYNMFLDGNVLRKYDRSVDKEWLVGELNFGASLRYKDFYVSYSWCLRSKEYKTQRGGVQYFSAIMIGGTF